MAVIVSRSRIQVRNERGGVGSTQLPCLRQRTSSGKAEMEHDAAVPA
jgi:hypothetical protein